MKTKTKKIIALAYIIISCIVIFCGIVSEVMWELGNYSQWGNEAPAIYYVLSRIGGFWCIFPGGVLLVPIIFFILSVTFITKIITVHRKNQSCKWYIPLIIISIANCVFCCYIAFQALMGI